jgi:hypothetical protein
MQYCFSSTLLPYRPFPASFLFHCACTPLMSNVKQVFS